MPHKTFNLTDDLSAGFGIDIGFDYRKTVAYTDSDSVAIDLTNSTLIMDIKEAKADVSTVITLTNSAVLSTSGLYIADASTGIFVINITNDDTNLFTERSYLYSISLEDSLGVKSLFMQGAISASSGVL